MPSCAGRTERSCVRLPTRAPRNALRCRSRAAVWPPRSSRCCPTMTEPKLPPVESLSFEQAQAELEQIVERLEDQHTGLDDALALWERGEALHAWCQKKLD